MQIPSARKARKNTRPCNQLRSSLAAKFTNAHSVILVHGIGGHWKESWERGDFSWVKHFLQPDLEKAGLTAAIRSYGYDSRTSANSVANVEDVATALLSWMYNYEPSGPIIFVAHSLGGLVVKKVGNELIYPVQMNFPCGRSTTVLTTYRYSRQSFSLIRTIIVTENFSKTLGDVCF